MRRFTHCFLYTLNEKPMIAIMVLATFAVPIATLTLIWELNTPRNVSIAEVIQLFVIGGGLAVVMITLWYLIPIFGNMPGIVEETSKLLAVIIVTYRVRGSRFPYQLNGILFGATVGAGFACSETLGYGLDQFAQGIITFVQGRWDGHTSEWIAAGGGADAGDESHNQRTEHARAAFAVWTHRMDGNHGGRVLAGERGQNSDRAACCWMGDS